MEVIGCAINQININVSRDELLVMNAALNEVCNGVEVFEFETRIGVSKALVKGNGPLNSYKQTVRRVLYFQSSQFNRTTTYFWRW